MSRNAIVIKGTNFSTNKLTTVTIVQDEKPCTAISLSDSTKSVAALGDFTLTATVTPNDTTDSVVWTSSDSTVATVAAGVVSVVGLGTATITATCGNQTATCVVTCSEVTISPYFAFAKRTNMTQYPNIFNLNTSLRELLIANEIVEGRRTLRNGSSSAALNSCPIMLPANTATVELSYGSDMRSGTIYFAWCDTTTPADATTYPNIANMVNLDTSNSSAYNQAKTWSYEKYTGADSFAIIVTPVSADYSQSDTPEGIATAKGIVVKCKPAASSN